MQEALRDLLPSDPGLAARLVGQRDGSGVSPGLLLALTVALRSTEAWNVTQLDALVLAAAGAATAPLTPSSPHLARLVRSVLSRVRSAPSPELLRPALAARRDALLDAWTTGPSLAQNAPSPWGPPSRLAVLPPPADLPQLRALTGLFRTDNPALEVPELGASQHGAPWRAQAGMVYPKAPEWMRRAVFYGGEESGRRTLGTTPWWWATADSPTATLAVWSPRSAESLAHLVSFRVADERFAVFTVSFPQADKASGPVTYSYTYDLHDPWDTAEFTLAVRSCCARLDVLHLGQDDDLPTVRRTLLLDFPAPVAAAAADALGWALARPGHHDLSRVRPGRAAPAEEFRASDRARSRDLAETLDLLGDLPQVPVRRRARFRKALRDLERLRVERAEYRYHQPSQPYPYRASLKLQSAELQVRALVKDVQAGPGPLARDLSVLGSDDRALVHLQLGADGPRAVWARTVQGTVRAGTLDFPRFNLEEFARRTTAWAADARRPLPLPRVVALLLSDLTNPLTETLRGEGVRHLVLSPTGLFSLLPLHAAPVPSAGSGRLLTDCFGSVTYAPSLAALAALDRRAEPLRAVPAFFRHGADLPGLATEQLVLRRLYGADLEVFDEGTATPAAVLSQGRTSGLLHISAHGGLSADPYATGLHLSPGPHGDAPHQGRLTLGRILRDGDFDAVQLAVLANCSSGTHRAGRLGFQRCRTLDTAFHARGVRAVLSTLWPLNDLASPVFTAVLHAHLRQSAAPADAFRAATTYLRESAWERVPYEDALYEAEDALTFARPSWRTDLRAARAHDPVGWDGHWACWKSSGLLW
ncbi:CHAT domain-containing protein [Streptomyces sp. D54]|uniref:CHAT domain-containing protein n=1 Tax=Streptomyces sp. D54 TaxID=1290289 RepID=UPI003CF79A3B